MALTKEQTKRLSEILKILSKYKLADWFKNTKSEAILSKLKGAGGEDLSQLSVEVRVRMALTELGTTFIKLGQVLSTRPDLVGPVVAEELTKLQSNVPADSFASVQQTILEDTGLPVSEIFEEFSETPLASASIGQVHLARLNGEKVVVKVQHAGIQEVVINDLVILMWLAGVAESTNAEARHHKPTNIAAAFRRSLLAEMDFVNEMRHLQTFNSNFENDKGCHFAHVYPEVTTQRVFPQELLVGVPVTKIETLEKTAEERREFARRLGSAYMDMIFRDAIYHADPHPGNIFVMDDNVVGFLDFGAVGRIEPELQEQFEGLMIALFERDATSLVDEILRIGSGPSQIDRNRLRGDISELLATYLGVPIKDIDLTELTNSLFDVIRSHRISFPAGVPMLVKVLGQIDGTCRMVDGDFQFMDLLGTYYGKIVQKRLSPQALVKRATRSMRYWLKVVDMVPRQLVLALEAIEKKSLHVKMEHKGFDQVVNRLVYAVLGSTLLFTGTTMLGDRVGPLLWDLSVPGGLALGAGAILAIRVLRAVAGSGGLKTLDE